MRRIVFYSWQSDLPNSCNRGFIQKALEETATTIAADNTVAVEPVIDRDTQNVPGAPDIASTIFSKIAAADIFVADVSLTTRAEGQRSTPNPNVLIELGYALKALGHERIVLVFNLAFGKIEELPFDLRMRRLLTYTMPEKVGGKAAERAELKAKCESSIRIALQAVPSAEVAPPVAIPAVAAIEHVQPNRLPILRRNLDAILKRIYELEPKKPSKSGTTEELFRALEHTQEPMAEFSRISEAISTMGDKECGIEVMHWFGKIFVNYHLPKGFSGGFNRWDFDYFKFIGHEALVTFVAFMMRERKWDILHQLLDESIPISYLQKEDGPGNVTWEYASEHIEALLAKSENGSRISVHADILNARHSAGGGLATILPIEELVAADFFLYLKSQRPWRPWSCLYLEAAPRFIKDAVRRQYAEQVAKALGLSNIEDLKRLILAKGPGIERLFQRGFWIYPLDIHDIDQMGTR